MVWNFLFLRLADRIFFHLCALWFWKYCQENAVLSSIKKFYHICDLKVYQWMRCADWGYCSIWISVTEMSNLLHFLWISFWLKSWNDTGILVFIKKKKMEKQQLKWTGFLESDRNKISNVWLFVCGQPKSLFSSTVQQLPEVSKQSSTFPHNPSHINEPQEILHV